MNIYYLSVKEGTPPKGYWDMALLGDILKDCVEISSTREVDEAIVIIPGAYQGEYVDKINKELSYLKKCTVIITSDEESKFPLHKLTHPNMRLFSTNIHKTTANVTWLPVGYTPHIHLKKEWKGKDIELLYAGQNNHIDRNIMIQKLSGLEGELHLSQGFGQGLNPETYIEKMSRAKVVPCPRGNINVDTFRFYESLELGAVPIPQGKAWWDTLFGTYPFPVIENHNDWKGYVLDTQSKYPKKNIECQAWWYRQKHIIKEKLLGHEDITVVIPISPIPSHPSIDILRETINSIKIKCKIILLFDGVRKEQEHLRKVYEEHIQRVLFEFNHVYPIIFDDHLHQIGMLRNVIEEIKSPLIMFIEQDTPIVIDEPIEWDKIKQFILSGQSNLIRFYHEASIHPEHKHLMLETKDIFTETIQWSSRPHIASTAFYARILRDYFSPNAKCFTEDVLHGKVLQDYDRFGRHGWEQWKLHLYNPGGNIKRSIHTDGRAGSPKLDNTQVW